MAKQITIGLPVLNSMPYLRDAVESLLCQTESDFDILAIVDPSTDDSVAYLESVQDPRLRVIVHERRAGLAATLNEILREARTPWLVRLDSDDVAYPERVASVTREIGRHPDAGMFYSLAEFHPADRCVGMVRQTRGTAQELRRLVRSGYLVTFVHPTAVLHVEKTLRLGGYNELLRTEDMDLWWRMILAHEVRLIPEVLVGFRTNSGSLMSRDLRENITPANVLYVQYLLLSHLWGYPPQKQSSVHKLLAEISRHEDHRPRISLRQCNIYLSRGQYFRAANAALRAVIASPRYCLQRLGDELIPSRQKRVRIGYHPSIYRHLRAELWPEPALPEGHHPPGERVFIGALPLDRLTFDEAVAWTIRYMRNKTDRPAARLSCPNASLITLADADEGFAHIVRTSNLVVADGLPLVWAAALLGSPLGGQIRGVDLMERLCAAGAEWGMSFYILGGLPGAAELAAKRLTARYPGLRSAGTECPPVSFENDPEASRRVRDRIASAAPDFLIVALGSPKQEWWIYENYLDLPVGAIQGVGAAIDTLSGLKRRPPVWMRNIGFEWLGRLLAEPHRLWRRYIFGNARFLYLVFHQWRMAGRIRSRRISVE